MEIEISSDTRLIDLLHELGIWAETVLITVNGSLSPETAVAKKGDKVRLIFYKHVPPFMSSSAPKGHWAKARHASRCQQCKSEPAIYLPQTKQHLCEKHFSASILKRIKKTVRTRSMIKKGERIGIGLSGGKDSYALIHALAALRETLPFEPVALTIDEGIPGYRDKALERAKLTCKKLKIEPHLFSFSKELGTTIMEIAGKGKENLCSYCGVFRRRILNSKARGLGLDKIAIGHNLDDVAQTAIMNMVRNEPMRFARFNSPLVADERMVQRIRPLRDIREKEIAAYALLKGHEFNSGCCCPFSKNALRQSVRHELNALEDQHPGTKTKIAASFDSLQKIIHDSVPKDDLEIGVCKKCGEPCSETLCMPCKMLESLSS